MKGFLFIDDDKIREVDINIIDESMGELGPT